MAARINIKNIDYFKFRKLIIDGSRDDYNSCSKEVKALCDSVQTLNFRDEEFDDESDRSRLADICFYYKQILASKRIDSADMRIKSGWWGDHKNAYSAGKLKPAILKEILLAKCNDWGIRNGLTEEQLKGMADKIDGPGLYVIKHKDHQCFQYVGRADKIFARFADRIKAAFDGNWQEPLAALLVISMVNDWDFYFTPVGVKDDEKVLRIIENDFILKHDAIWPHGLNCNLHIDTLLEVSEFRKSCLRHHWPPNDVVEDREIDLVKLRKHIAASMKGKKQATDKPVATVAPAPPPWKGVLDIDKPQEPEPEPERPDSAMSSTSTMISTVTTSSNSTTSSSDSMMTQLTEIRIKKEKGTKSPTRPTSASKKKGGGTSPNAEKKTLQRSNTFTKDSPTSPSENGDDPDSEGDSTIDRTPSMSSLSSTGASEKTEKSGKTPGTPNKSGGTPKKKAAGSRPSSAKARTSTDKSRLPVSGKK